MIECYFFNPFGRQQSNIVSIQNWKRLSLDQTPYVSGV